MFLYMIEFIKLIGKTNAFYLFYPTSLINSIIHEHTCKILNLIFQDSNSQGPVKKRMFNNCQLGLINVKMLT